jgi:hypothetical protein
MAYSGKYKVKNPSKYKGDHTNVVYRSLWEKHVMKWCDEQSDIVQWSSEEVVIPYLYEVDNKIHRYFMDFKIKFKSGKTILVEVKPNKETKVPKGDKRTKRYLNEAMTYVKNQNKWKAAAEFAKDNGWGFEIWTEKELTALGIMPKSRQPLKPLKPFKPYKKSKK